MGYSPFGTDKKVAFNLPVSATELPTPDVKHDEVPTTRGKRFLRSNLGKVVIYFAVFGLLAAGLTLVLGWVLARGSIPKVTLRQGTFQGIIIDRPNFPKPVEAHLGIPYALPPVGELRFARPQPVLPSNETFEASSFGSR